MVNDYYLVRTARFEPRGVLSGAELAAEHITAFRWSRHAEIAGYDGTDLFSPRDLATPIASVILHGAPAMPVALGL